MNTHEEWPCGCEFLNNERTKACDDHRNFKPSVTGFKPATITDIIAIEKERDDAISRAEIAETKVRRLMDLGGPCGYQMQAEEERQRADAAECERDEALAKIERLKEDNGKYVDGFIEMRDTLAFYKVAVADKLHFDMMSVVDGTPEMRMLRNLAQRDRRIAELEAFVGKYQEYRFRCSDTPGATATLDAIQYALDDAATAFGFIASEPATEPKAPEEPMWTREKVQAALEKEKANCAKGKHWLGLNADLSPATACAWDFCSYGKPSDNLDTHSKEPK